MPKQKTLLNHPPSAPLECPVCGMRVSSIFRFENVTVYVQLGADGKPLICARYTNGTQDAVRVPG